MHRNHQENLGDGSDGSAPSESWLFAQAILGNPIPRIINPETRARQERAELERLAQFSTAHADELRQLQAAEAEARHDRENLEWAAGISTAAEAELRDLVRQEAEEREAWRCAEQFYESYVGGKIKWSEADHPRRPKGTSDGGEWVSKGGGGPSAGRPPSSFGANFKHDRDVSARVDEPEAMAVADASNAKSGERSRDQDPKAAYLRRFDKGHDLTLKDALKDGKLSIGDVLRVKFTEDEIKQILKSSEKTAPDFDLTFYTAQNLPERLRAKAERDFADLPGDEKYAMQAFISNQNRARATLMTRNPTFRRYIGELYEFLRSLNPVHFIPEKGLVVWSGTEPVLGGKASRLGALKDMLIYIAIMKGVSWGTSKITNIIAGPEAAGEITITFKGGGKVTIRRGAEYSPQTLEKSVERAAAGETVEINPPAPKLPRPSLTEVPTVKDDPKAFRRWFNELTPEEFNAVWKNPRLRKAVEVGLRWPKGKHEWLMIARTPKFKEWGVTAEQIAEMSTPTSKVRFKNPPGGHKGEGSITTHNQILKIIDSSPDFATFKTRLQEWANNRLEGGAAALPPGLRP